ncbi:heterokaryon incompatibility protein-domain-containing protein [Tricladium varicosporioides]|nr:heterokaryon incompatibility protein-domain-containing protein [Hymenoscyphus varicosporioides]
MYEVNEKYFSLHPGEIRVADILPGKWEDKICCWLRHAPMANRPSYKALSYVWGAPKGARRSIILNGDKHLVTMNLESALKRIRETDRVVTYWIDALCINQDDNDERSNQVSLMRDIYARAEVVVIYLGEVPNHSFAGSANNTCMSSDSSVFHGDNRDSKKITQFRQYCRSKDGERGKSRARLDYSHEAFCLISSLAQNTKLEHNPPFDNDSRNHSDSFYQRNLFEALRYLMRSTWWNRIWVVQEVVVSNNITLLYGSIIVHWNVVVSAARSYSLNQLSDTISSFSHEYSNVLALFSRIVLGIHQMRGRWQAGERTTLLSLLRQFSHRKATDDRDKVYALLGLVQDPQMLDHLMVVPDYSHDTATVFRNTVLKIIETTRSLDILAGDIGRKNRQDLPSWLLDWSATYDDLDRRRAEDIQHYNATAGMDVLTESDKENPYSGTERYLISCGARIEPHFHLDSCSTALNSSEWTDYILDPYGGLGKTVCLEAISKYLAVEGHRVWLRDHDGVLECPGVCKGRVVVVGDPCFSHEDLTTVVKGWGIQVAQFFMNNHASKTKEEVSLSFLKTICADIVHLDTHIGGSNRRRVTNDDLGSIAAWILRIPSSSDETGASKFWRTLLHNFRVPDPELLEGCVGVSVDAAIRTASLRRRLFITDSGHIGLGPAGLKLDDELYVILGARTPFILRKTGSSIPKIMEDETSKGYIPPQGFQLIGDCYAYGLMDGEALVEWKAVAKLWLSSPEDQLLKCRAAYTLVKTDQAIVDEAKKALEKTIHCGPALWLSGGFRSLKVDDSDTTTRFSLKKDLFHLMEFRTTVDRYSVKQLEFFEKVVGKIKLWLREYDVDGLGKLQDAQLLFDAIEHYVKVFEEHISGPQAAFVAEMDKLSNISWTHRRQTNVFLV